MPRGKRILVTLLSLLTATVLLYSQEKNCTFEQVSKEFINEFFINRNVEKAFQHAHDQVEFKGDTKARDFYIKDLTQAFQKVLKLDIVKSVNFSSVNIDSTVSEVVPYFRSLGSLKRLTEMIKGSDTLRGTYVRFNCIQKTKTEKDVILIFVFDLIDNSYRLVAMFDN